MHQHTGNHLERRMASHTKLRAKRCSVNSYLFGVRTVRNLRPDNKLVNAVATGCDLLQARHRHGLCYGISHDRNLP
jgi:hypothetical protein